MPVVATQEQLKEEETEKAETSERTVIKEEAVIVDEPAEALGQAEVIEVVEVVEEGGRVEVVEVVEEVKEPEPPKELTFLEKQYNLVAFEDPIFGVKIVSPFEMANSEWTVLLKGIEGTPFEGGVFKINLGF